MIQPPSKTVRPLSQKPFLLTATCLYILLMFFSFSAALADDYVFRNKEYKEVGLPKRPVILMKAPGILLNSAPSHTPTIQIKSRREGLQTLRLLEFDFPDMPSGDGKIALYVLDKDNLIIGYADLSAGERHAEILINSVINYAKIYVECSKHGLWFEELQIPL